MSELFTLDTLQEFWAKRPKGAKFQYLCSGDWELRAEPPRTGDEISAWRWEPQSKPVDLSPLVGSDVLCEFSDGGDGTRLGYLACIEGEYFDRKDGASYYRCNPVMNKWMAVSEDTKIPDGLEYRYEVTGADHILIVKFTGLKKGYHRPWGDKS